MKSYILTEHERDVLHKFLKNKTKSVEVRVLLHRIRKNYERLKEDFELISKLRST